MKFWSKYGQKSKYIEETMKLTGWIAVPMRIPKIGGKVLVSRKEWPEKRNCVVMQIRKL